MAAPQGGRRDGGGMARKKSTPMALPRVPKGALASPTLQDEPSRLSGSGFATPLPRPPAAARPPPRPATALSPRNTAHATPARSGREGRRRTIGLEQFAVAVNNSPTSLQPPVAAAALAASPPATPGVPTPSAAALEVESGESSDDMQDSSDDDADTAAAESEPGAGLHAGESLASARLADGGHARSTSHEVEEDRVETSAGGSGPTATTQVWHGYELQNRV